MNRDDSDWDSDLCMYWDDINDRRARLCGEVGGVTWRRDGVVKLVV
jgi:hypothetical protein